MNKIINDREIIVNDENYIAVDDNNESAIINCKKCEFYHDECVDKIFDDEVVCVRKDGDIHWIKQNKTLKEEKNEMKYEMIKPISGKTIIQEGACEDEAVEFINKFGISTEIEWTKEVEDYMMKQNGWIKFAIDKKFIKEVEVEYSSEKVYFMKGFLSVIYKLSMSEDNNYTWSPIKNTKHSLGVYGSIDDAVKGSIDNKCEVRIFDTIQEAMNFYFPTKTTYSIRPKTDLEKIQKAKDILDSIGFNVDCSVITDCANNESLTCGNF